VRLFVALELSSDTIDFIEEWRKPLIRKYSDLRWTGGEQLHVTLRFLGDRNPDQVAGEMRNLCLEELLPIEYTISRIGQFGNPPSVLWLSGSFSSEVFSMAQRLDSIPDGEGKTGGSRHFNPHVTLARIRRGSSCPNITFSRQIAGVGSAIHLMSSNLTPDGSIYTTLFSVE